MWTIISHAASTMIFILFLGCKQSLFCLEICKWEYWSSKVMRVARLLVTKAWIFVSDFYWNCSAISRFSDSSWDLEAKSWECELTGQTVRVGRSLIKVLPVYSFPQSKAQNIKFQMTVCVIYFCNHLPWVCFDVKQTCSICWRGTWRWWYELFRAAEGISALCWCFKVSILK